MTGLKEPSTEVVRPFMRFGLAAGALSCEVRGMEILEVTDLEKTYRSPDGEDHRAVSITITVFARPATTRSTSFGCVEGLESLVPGGFQMTGHEVVMSLQRRRPRTRRRQDEGGAAVQVATVLSTLLDNPL